VGRANDDAQIGAAARRIADAVGQRQAFALSMHEVGGSQPEHHTDREIMSNESHPRISVDPNVHFGKPCVAGTRIPVRDVLELLRAGRSVEAVTTDYYPDLEDADVQACAQYALDRMDAAQLEALGELDRDDDASAS